MAVDRMSTVSTSVRLSRFAMPRQRGMLISVVLPGEG